MKDEYPITSDLYSFKKVGRMYFNFELSYFCGYFGPGYLQDDSTECTRRVQDVASQCETEPALAARNFYEGFQVVKVGEVLICLIIEWIWATVV